MTVSPLCQQAFDNVIYCTDYQPVSIYYTEHTIRAIYKHVATRQLVAVEIYPATLYVVFIRATQEYNIPSKEVMKDELTPCELQLYKYISSSLSQFLMEFTPPTR